MTYSEQLWLFPGDVFVIKRWIFVLLVLALLFTVSLFLGISLQHLQLVRYHFILNTFRLINFKKLGRFNEKYRISIFELANLCGVFTSIFVSSNYLKKIFCRRLYNDNIFEWRDDNDNNNNNLNSGNNNVNFTISICLQSKLFYRRKCYLKLAFVQQFSYKSKRCNETIDYFVSFPLIM